MAVELSKLYREIYADYDVELLTSGCFGKKDQLGAYHGKTGFRLSSPWR